VTFVAERAERFGIFFAFPRIAERRGVFRYFVGLSLADKHILGPGGTVWPTFE